jgi:predicted DNA-binding antitoxin AbrB/MazE fold protein
MSLVVEARFENGTFKLAKPVALPEGTQVRLTITPVDEDYDPLEGVIGIGEGRPDGAENHDKYIYGKIRP